jgi:hypothetical protein
MALTPIDETHALQIQAGLLGRRAGHGFEEQISAEINKLAYPHVVAPINPGHVFTGDPAAVLINFTARHYQQETIQSAVAISTGALATSEEGVRWLDVNGIAIKRCKSDLLITFRWPDGGTVTAGVSTKQCGNPKPTNAQLYFTTAQGFAKLLTDGGIPVTPAAIKALKQFCGDVGHRPQDDPSVMVHRLVDPRRWFWEEIDPTGRAEWERIFTERQDHVSRLLLQKAYLNDPFAPDFLLHKTKGASAWATTEVAIYSIEELIRLSRAYKGFVKKPYKDSAGVFHEAPRFGIVQMQRGGQKQHPTQLQFNLEAGYFYKVGK